MQSPIHLTEKDMNSSEAPHVPILIVHSEFPIPVFLPSAQNDNPQIGDLTLQFLPHGHTIGSCHVRQQQYSPVKLYFRRRIQFFTPLKT